MAISLLKKALTLPQNVFASVKTHGLQYTIDHAICKVVEVWHERRLGIKSCGYIKLCELGVDNQACNDYAPIEYQSFHKVLKKLDIKPGKDVFLDYGSGMGRAVISAATYPFQKVIGIELSAELNVIAEENIRRALTKLKCKDIEVITADAASYLPPENVTVFFLFNPFNEEIMSHVFDSIRTSLAKAPRDITVVYQPPVEKHNNTMADNCGWLVKRGEFNGYSYPANRRITFVYKNSPNL